MLFSCLVDADFLDTEKFMNEGRNQLRAGYPSLPELQTAFDLHMKDKAAKVTDSPVNRIRAQLLRQCREKAVLPSGLFSLTVPTDRPGHGRGIGCRKPGFMKQCIMTTIS